MGQASVEMRTISYNAAFSACVIGGGCPLRNVRPLGS
jgi:hypothetical protein